MDAETNEEGSTEEFPVAPAAKGRPPAATDETTVEDPPGAMAHAAAPADEGVAPGALLSSRYRIEKEIGRGAMGAIFLGRHELMNKPVAIKVLQPDRGAFVERFQREARALGQLDHRNVCTATDFGKTDDGSFFLVMEYLDGITLTQAIEQAGGLPVERALAVFEQIVSALVSCHSKGIIHRDLKPDNVMLVDRDGETDVVKVLDFGIASAQRAAVAGQQKLTAVGTTLGTPVYMSPEQSMADKLDARSDLYSLGVMLFESLTGSPPFQSDDAYSIIQMHVTKPPPKLREVAPQLEVPEELEHIVEKLLRKTPEERYSDAQELLTALQAVPRGSASRAPSATGPGETAHIHKTGPPRPVSPVSPVAPAAKPALQSRPVVLGAAGGVVLLLIIILAASSGGDGAPAASPTGVPTGTVAPPPTSPTAQPDPTRPVPEPSTEPVLPLPKILTEEPATEEPDGQPPVVADARGMIMRRHVVAPGRHGYDPADEGISFADTLRHLYCFIAVDSRPSGGRRLTLVWYHGQREVYRRRVKIKSSNRYRTYIKTKVKEGQVGSWRCDLLDEDGNVISRAPFQVYSASNN